jgi:hypothetical protein
MRLCNFITGNSATTTFLEKDLDFGYGENIGSKSVKEDENDSFGHMSGGIWLLKLSVSETEQQRSTLEVAPLFFV